ncbi:MAG: hypothetical protein J6J23_05685 [Clostridia bacterium]|nr:hypothetical protein [Clostridia bacterium]
MKGSKPFGIFNLIALSLLVLVLIGISTLPMLKIEKRNNSVKHLESDNNMQAIIEVWNVDTFSGGNISKTDYLNKVARLFENANKGLYINVRNMSVDEFVLAKESGKLPSVISFGYGVGSVVRDLLTPLNNVPLGMNAEVKNSGIAENTQLAVGYAMGGYAYFSTSEKLSEASNNNDITFSKDFVNCGFNKTLRKSTKHIYGLAYGKNSYISPMKCLAVENSSEILESPDDYNAYIDFISLNKATILLGTQRDLVKLKGKLDRGAIQDLLIEPVASYNDLIQYVGVVKGNNEQFDKLAKLFIETLLCESSQKLLSESGLFSTTIPHLYADSYFSLIEDAVWSCKNIPKVF